MNGVADRNQIVGLPVHDMIGESVQVQIRYKKDTYEPVNKKGFIDYLDIPGGLLWKTCIRLAI